MSLSNIPVNSGRSSALSKCISFKYSEEFGMEIVDKINEDGLSDKTAESSYCCEQCNKSYSSPSYLRVS